MFPVLGSFVDREGNGRDKWESYDPTRTGWTDVGTPTVAGRWQRRGRLVLVSIKVTPSTSVATTAGTSYVSLPVTADGYGGGFTMVNLSTNIAVGVCVVDAANSRVYVPTLAATANTLMINGYYEV